MSPHRFGFLAPSCERASFAGVVLDSKAFPQQVSSPCKVIDGIVSRLTNLITYDVLESYMNIPISHIPPASRE